MAATTQAASRPVRRRSGRRQQTLLARLIRGLLVAVGVTLACILLFAFMMQWLKPSDGVIRVINQLIKLTAIFIGVRLAVSQGGERGLLTGALVGFLHDIKQRTEHAEGEQLDRRPNRELSAVFDFVVAHKRERALPLDLVFEFADEVFVDG